MKQTKLLTAVAVFLFSTQIASASNRPGATTVTLAEGYYAFSAKRHLDNTGLPNILLAYNFNQQWAMEGGVGVINTEQKNSGSGVHGFLYTIDGLYRFTPRGMLEPYVLAGIGATGLKPNGNDSEYQGNLNAGVGAQVFFDRSIALRGEVKDIYTFVGGKNDVLANFGVSFLIG